MGFFLTGAGPGKGADLGGLDGADAHCQALANASGAGKRVWRAYLSTSAVAPAAGAASRPAVNARDRIGKGPWFNAKGELIARDVDQLHAANGLTKATALNERGTASTVLATHPISTTSSPVHGPTARPSRPHRI